MKIGKLAKHANINIDTIRYYEQRQLLPVPKRTPSGYRNYSANDVQRLQFIVHAKALGFTLEEIKALLGLRASATDCCTVRAIAERKASEIAARIASLSRIQHVLLELAEQCAQEGSDEACPILKSLETPL